MSSTYTVYLGTPFGVRQAVLPFLSLEYTLAVNTVGALTVVLSQAIDPALFVRDAQIEVWRSVDGGPEYLEGGKVWLLRRSERTIRANGERTSTLTAACCNDLLRRREIAYDSGTAYTSKTGAADDLIKAFARENLGSGVTSDRDVSAYADISSLLSINADISQAPSLTVAAARDNLLSTCQKIAQASATAGTYLAFDITWTGAVLQLATYTQQRGTDHRSPLGLNPVILSPDFGNLSDVIVTDNYQDEATITIAGGQGTADSRTIATATDTVRTTASPFGGVERFVQANTTGDATALADVADAALRNGRPRRSVAGRIQETVGTRYGRDWGWGDQVTVQVDTVSANARIDAVAVRVAGGVETIDAAIRIDDA